MRLANDELHCKAHTYCPAYTPDTMRAFLQGSSHITFNSLSQYARFYPQTKVHGGISCGLRVNPGYSCSSTTPPLLMRLTSSPRPARCL